MNHLTNYDHHTKQVMKFNIIAGNTLDDKLTLLPLYHTLSIEEFSGKNEFKESLGRKDLSGIIDGLVDMYYVGTYWYYLQHSQLYQHQPPHINVIDEEGVNLVCDNIQRSLDTHDSESYLNNLHVLLTYINGTTDMNRAFECVHTSNLSKFINMSGLPLECIMERAEVEVGYLSSKYDVPTSDIDWNVVKYEGDQYLVFRNANGKIIKPSTFEDVDLTWVDKR